MAPRPLPQSSPPTMTHYNGTQQWHHVHSPKVGRHPPPNPYHTTMAPSNGTTSTASCNGTLVPHSPKVGRHPPPNHTTLQWHPTMAPSNGTTSTAPCNGTLVPRPISQSASSPSPLLEVRTPIAIAIWGIIINNHKYIRVCVWLCACMCVCSRPEMSDIQGDNTIWYRTDIKLWNGAIWCCMIQGVTM